MHCKLVTSNIKLVHQSNLDPLFALEGTDYRQMNSAVEDLENSVRKTASLYNKTDSKTIEDTLYPIDFLKEITKVEEVRQNLTGDPSFENIDSYYKNIAISIDLPG